MQVVLAGLHPDTEGGSAAQSGSATHMCVEVFHRTAGDPQTRQEAAVAEISRALVKFPKADETKVRKWTKAYTADEKNILADVRAIELPVTLNWNGVFFKGTLDQIRAFKHDEYMQFLVELHGRHLAAAYVPDPIAPEYETVWDLKTGVSMDAGQSVAEYQAQQAVYVLAARETLGRPILPGGLILTTGYDKPGTNKFAGMGLTLKHAEAILTAVSNRVLAVRSGAREFTPSASACQWCQFKSYPKCVEVYKQF